VVGRNFCGRRKVEPKIFARLQTPSKFSEDRCTQFRVIVVTYPHTDMTDYNTLRRSLARSVMSFPFSALTVLVGRREGHLVCKTLGVGLLVVVI